MIMSWDVTELNWDDYDGTASWEEPEDAKRYEVRLYRDGSSISSAISTTDTSYNFASYFTRSGDYTFKVRAIYNSSNKGDWEESDELSVSSSEARDIRDNGRSSGNTPSNSVNDDGALEIQTAARAHGLKMMWAGGTATQTAVIR